MILVVSLGPIFFAIIHTSIDRGFWAAAWMAVGTLASDAFYICVSYFGLSTAFENPDFRFWLGVAGGIMLIVFGVFYFMKAPPVDRGEKDVLKKKANPLLFMLRGFAINSINPFMFIFWLGVMSVVSVQEHYTKWHVLLFFSGTLTTVFTSDILKSYLANRISKWINPMHLIWLNRISGSAMCLFGVRLLWKVFVGKGI